MTTYCSERCHISNYTVFDCVVSSAGSKSTRHHYVQAYRIPLRPFRQIVGPSIIMKAAVDIVRTVRLPRDFHRTRERRVFSIKKCCLSRYKQAVVLGSNDTRIDKMRTFYLQRSNPFTRHNNSSNINNMNTGDYKKVLLRYVV